MDLTLDYHVYLDRVWGGWIGKSIGGTIGARFEGYKGWIDIRPEELFPPTVPPNDDLDLQILWLKVLEELGASLTSQDLARAWLEHCWYPFNEYGTFRRNWRLGIAPPYSGSYDNAFWETGMGCPIRSEIWGYVCPGAPDLAAELAGRDGVLDHTAQSVGAERMFAAMAAMAFFMPDLRRLIEMNRHYLPAGTPIARSVQAGLRAFDQGLTLRQARELLIVLEGHPEACDAQLNVPFTLLALLYGGGDLQETLLAALHCGYDTDCTLATAAAFIGQILGARGIPAHLKAPIGDALVMGISYHRPEMTLSALARDTVRVGALLSRELHSAVEIIGAPALAPLPVRPPRPRLRVEYHGLPCAAPGEPVAVTVHVEGPLCERQALAIACPAGWSALPTRAWVSPTARSAHFTLLAAADMPALPQRNLFTLTLGELHETFGVAGVGLWRFLGVFFDPLPPPDQPLARERAFQHHFVDVHKRYLPEPDCDQRAQWQRWSQLFGRPAVVVSREREVDLRQVTGLRGEFVAYLARTLLSPQEQDATFVIGHNDGFRLYLNDALVCEADEQLWWTPFNRSARVHLRQGANRLLLVLIRRGEAVRFTLGVRQAGPGGHNREDWCVDLADENPICAL